MTKYVIKIDGLTFIKESRKQRWGDLDTGKGTKLTCDWAVCGIWKAGTKENPMGMTRPRFVIGLALDKADAEKMAKNAMKKYNNVTIVPCGIDESGYKKEKAKQQDREYKIWAKKNKNLLK